MKLHWIILSSLIMASLAAPLHGETEADPLVTIHVLSKQVRLLKSGAIKRIAIRTKKGSTITDEAGNGWPGEKTIEMFVRRGSLEMYLESQPVYGIGTLSISSTANMDAAEVSIDGAVRTYPLPMTLRHGRNDVRVYVTERLNRYAVDSALAEYSGKYWKETEGILALAHLIRARYYHAKKRRHHDDADFCDLTHCQVYRGRIERSLGFNDDWVIDHEKMRDILFFHSRCGGKTFDPGVFCGRKDHAGAGGTNVRDWLYREGRTLCSGAESHWERTISQEDLRAIFFSGSDGAGNPSLTLRYDTAMLKVHVASSSGDLSFPVETFRLKLNRVKGWNFIRSNAFTVSEKVMDGIRHFHFRGEGLGHGVGLCQHGAVALSRLGYNRYEILEHYYPDIQFMNIGSKAWLSPYCSYCLFDLATGKTISSTQGPGLLQRKIPPGSLFKLIVALYIAAERPDIFNDYTFDCNGRNRDDKNLPERCWKPRGHGRVWMKDAIPSSCNLYFASLYKVIPEKKFRAFYRVFCSSLGIDAPLPAIAGEKQWAELLAGLDFRVSFTVNDCMRLARYLYFGNAGDPMPAGPELSIPFHEKMQILKGLRETFTRGTALEQNKRTGAPCNYLCLDKAGKDDSDRQLLELWGKTSTVVDGTNKPVSYGIFLGGNGTRGIIVIVRKATGNMASRWARRILLQTVSGE